jgi:hypothetical protein
MKTNFLVLLLLTVVIFLSANPLSAQAFFRGVGVPVTVASTGQTEVIGMIVVAMTSAPAVPDTLVINLSPLQITNANPTDIVVKATGLAVGATTIDTVNSLVEIPLQASFTSTASMNIQGIRVAVAGTGITSFNAQLSWLNSGNVFISGPSVPVISSVQAPIVAKSITIPSAVTGQSNLTRSTIQIAEGFPGAFSNSSQYGQSGPTQLQITVTDFPFGEQLQFPVTVTANETLAVLTTVSGGPVTLTGNGTATYVYSSIDNSGILAESFNINMDLIPAINAQPTIHVTLAPIGAATPSSALPTMNIPRYAEDEVLVAPASSLTPKKILYWTGINPSLQNQIEVTNPASSQSSKLTLDALDSKGNAVSGTGVTSPVRITLSANQSLMSSVSNLFGTVAGISSIRIQSTTPDLLAAAFITGNGVNQAVPFVSLPVTSLIFPIVTDGAQFYIMNTTVAPITGTLTLLTAEGDPVSASAISLPPLGSTVLPVPTGRAPQSGYASAVFSDSVIAYESFGKGNLEPIQPPAAQPSIFAPFIAGGTSFKPSVKLINVSHQVITLNAGLFGSNGSLLATQPITMQPTEEVVETMQQMFSQSPDTAYVEFALPQTGQGIFASYPLIDGQAQLETTQGGSTVIPLSASQSADTFILGQAISSTAFEGIAFLNPTKSNVSVTVRALKIDGSVAATATLTLAARQLNAQLTSQLFDGTLPPQTVIRVTSSAPIAVTGITGSTGLDQILALPVMW